ncbi:MAG: TetR/AcrR family transcriptional regulator [Lachnospiraceae bacterium]|nr:TetR/AcrR family transcriptional regulator [Lachnospiraceae bacterium]
MGYDYDQTHERIIESAKKHFMENGFLGASIRQICKDAGVTNGAFYAHFESKEDLFSKIVSPVVNGMQKLYSEENASYMDIKSKKDVKKSLEKTFSSNEILIDYIFENAEEFKLIVTAGTGTEYEHFVDNLVKEETANTMFFLEKCRPYYNYTEKISEGLITQISHFTVSSVFDGLKGGKIKEEVVRDTKLASEFCLAGLKHFLDIK